MSLKIATISIDGIPTLSYRGTPGKILSPSTMPHEIRHEIGAMLCDGAPYWLGSDMVPVTESHEPKLHVRTLNLSIQPLAQGSAANTWTLLAPKPAAQVTWTGTEDYR